MSAGDAWMPLYVGDYLADTMHLSHGEHGAYLLLLMHSWRTGPLPGNSAALARIARCTPKEWAAMEATIMAFFTSADGGFVQGRLERERQRQGGKIEQRKAAGRASAAARASQREGNARSTNVEIPLQQNAREPEPELEPEEKTPPSPPKGGRLVVVPAWMPSEPWDDWCRFRRGKQWTPKAAELCIAKLSKLRDEGHDPRAVIEQSIANGWRGLFPIRDDARAERPGKLDWLPEIMGQIKRGALPQ